MNKVYMCIDLKSFYASVECVERGLEPLNTNLVVADESRTEKTVCLAITPSLKQYGLGGRARLFEVIQKVKEVNYKRRKENNYKKFSNKSFLDNELKKDKLAYARSFKIQYENTDPYISKPLIEQYDKTYVVQNIPSLPLTRELMDWTYGLDYERTYHPMYEKDGGVPAIKEVEFSLTAQRGCFGACNFCAIISM